MENQRDERVIFIKDLLFAALYQWRKILIVAVALAALASVYASVTEWEKASSAPSAKTKQELLERYQEEKSLIEHRIDSVTAQIESQEDYIAKSPVMSMDPNATYQAGLDFTVQTDYQILPGMNYQNIDNTNTLLRAYCAALNGDQLFGPLAEISDIPVKYVPEIVSVFDNSAANRTVRLTLTADTQQKAQALLDKAKEVLQTAQGQIRNSVGEHQLEIVSSSVSERLDTALAEAQTAALDRLETLYTTREDLKKQLSGLKAPQFGVKASMKIVVLYAVIGGFLGAAIVMFIAWIAHIVSGKVYSARTLTNRTGIKVLGCVAGPGKVCRLDAWLRALEGRSVAESMMAVAAANVRNHTSGKLLLIGDADDEGREQIRAALNAAGVQATACGSPLRSVEALDALAACDSVVLVEKCGVSRYNNVSAEIQLVLDQGKSLSGCVLLDG